MIDIPKDIEAKLAKAKEEVKEEEPKVVEAVPKKKAEQTEVKAADAPHQKAEDKPEDKTSKKTAEVSDDNEPVPIKPPLKVLKSRTINKKFGWWASVVLLESYAKKQICLYLWQKKDDGWKRKQKFGIHSKEDWQLMKKAVEDFSGELTS